MISVGCDIGTVATKACVLKGGTLMAYEIVPNEGQLSRAVETSVHQVLSKAGLSVEHVEAWGATGAGERYLSLPHATKNMISCLARGANWMLPSARTVVHIGGLSTTCVNINDQGKSMGYRTNDRCASGTGFFLELAAQALEISLEELDSVAGSASRKVPISSQCAVFGESEIVTHVNDGVEAAAIIAGISHSIGSGLATMARRLGIEPEIVATGGVAKMATVLKALEEDLGMEVKSTGQDPQLVVAIGAALCAAETRETP